MLRQLTDRIWGKKAPLQHATPLHDATLLHQPGTPNRLNLPVNQNPPMREVQRSHYGKEFVNHVHDAYWALAMSEVAKLIPLLGLHTGAGQALTGTRPLKIASTNAYKSKARTIMFVQIFNPSLANTAVSKAISLQFYHSFHIPLNQCVRQPARKLFVKSFSGNREIAKNFLQ